MQNRDNPEVAAQTKKILNRLRRAQGQLNAVINSVENEAHCREVITQLSAVTKALDRAGFAIVSTNLQECLALAQENPESEENAARKEELEKLFLMLA